MLSCLNGGTCSTTSIGGFVCFCLPNFTGTRCQDMVTTTIATTIEYITRTNDVCQSNPCLNAGSCVPNGVGGFLCQCLNGFVGNRCEARGRQKFHFIAETYVFC